LKAQGIEAEIPQASGTEAEELERKARSGRASGRMRPKKGVKNSYAFILVFLM
jgi:hypothetical protein